MSEFQKVPVYQIGQEFPLFPDSSRVEVVGGSVASVQSDFFLAHSELGEIPFQSEVRTMQTTEAYCMNPFDRRGTWGYKLSADDFDLRKRIVKNLNLPEEAFHTVMQPILVVNLQEEAWMKTHPQFFEPNAVDPTILNEVVELLKLDTLDVNSEIFGISFSSKSAGDQYGGFCYSEFYPTDGRPLAYNLDTQRKFYEYAEKRFPQLFTPQNEGGDGKERVPFELQAGLQVTVPFIQDILSSLKGRIGKTNLRITDDDTMPIDPDSPKKFTWEKKTKPFHWLK